MPTMSIDSAPIFKIGQYFGEDMDQTMGSTLLFTRNILKLRRKLLYGIVFMQLSESGRPNASR